MAQRQRHVLNGLPRDIGLDRRELATVLAALRFWQMANPTAIPSALTAIVTDGDQCNPLTNPEIDDLCERINVR